MLMLENHISFCRPDSSSPNDYHHLPNTYIASAAACRPIPSQCTYRSVVCLGSLLSVDALKW